MAASGRVKDRVRDHFEQKIDRLHRIADVVTFPLAPIDGAIHGIARGALNWLTDNHPEPKQKSYAQKSISPQAPPSYGYGGYAPPPQAPPSYGYAPPPQAPPPYYSNPSQPAPGYPYPPFSYHNTGGHSGTGNHNNSAGQTNHGAYKFGNIGSS